FTKIHVEVPCLLAQPASKALIKRCQPSPVLRASALDYVVVVGSRNCPERLRFRRSVEQRPAELYRDGAISAAVDEKDWGLDSRDLPARIEAPNKQRTDHRQNGSRHVAGRGEGGLQDHTPTLVPGCEVNGDRGAQ